MTTLYEHLAAWSAARSDRRDVVDTVAAIATRRRDSPRSSHWDRWLAILAGSLARARWRWSESPRPLCRRRFRRSSTWLLRRGGRSEKAAEVIVLNPAGSIVVAIDPLDGSDNVDINAPLGTVFSLLPTISSALIEVSFLAPGCRSTRRRLYPLRPAHIAGADTG